jgi:hypothetical protein
LPLQTGRAALRVASNRSAAVGYDGNSFDDFAHDSNTVEAADYVQPIPAGHDFSIDEGAASAHLRGAQPLPATRPTAQQGPPQEGLGAPAGPGGPALVQGGQSGTSATGPGVAEAAEDAEAKAEAQWTVGVLEWEAAALQAAISAAAAEAAASAAQEGWDGGASGGGSGGGGGARVGKFPFYEYVYFQPYADDD